MLSEMIVVVYSPCVFVCGEGLGGQGRSESPSRGTTASQFGPDCVGQDSGRGQGAGQRPSPLSIYSINYHNTAVHGG